MHSLITAWTTESSGLLGGKGLHKKENYPTPTMTLSSSQSKEQEPQQIRAFGLSEDGLKQWEVFAARWKPPVSGISKTDSFA